MTFNDDFIEFQLQTGSRRVACKTLGIEWPPPDLLHLFDFEWELVRRSQISDEQRKEMTHIMRGAQYRMVG